MNATRIFRNFLNLSQTTENTDLDTELTPEEMTHVIGYMNFHMGIEEHVTRAMLGTPGLIPESFLEKYNPDSNTSVNAFLGDLGKEDVGDFLDAVAKLPAEEPVKKTINVPVSSTVTPSTTLRLQKKFKGK